MQDTNVTTADDTTTSTDVSTVDTGRSASTAVIVALGVGVCTLLGGATYAFVRWNKSRKEDKAPADAEPAAE